MTRFNNVLFPTDFSEIADSTLAHAAYFCSAFDAYLHIVHADLSAEQKGAESEEYIPIDRQNWSDLFQSYVSSLDENGHDGEAVYASEIGGKSVPDILLQYIELHDIDLIVLGTHGRRGLGRLLLGSTAEEVVRLAKCPVMTIGGKAARAHEPALSKILVPIDFSDSSLKALDVAKELASAFDATIDLLHVIQPIAIPVPYGISLASVTSPEVREKARAALEEIGQSIDDTDLAIHIENGIPADRITVFAEENESDLIVIASHGLTGFDRFIQGSVSQEVVRLAPCPVFSVKSHSRA